MGVGSFGHSVDGFAEKGKREGLKWLYKIVKGWEKIVMSDE